MTDQRAQIEALCNEVERSIAATYNDRRLAKAIRILATTLEAPAPSEGEGELLPCPFCGGRGKLVWGTYERCNGWCVQCQGSKTCPLFCTTLYCVHDTEAEAIAAWNRRARPPSLQGAVQEAALEEAARVIENADTCGFGKDARYRLAAAIRALRTASDAGEVG